MERFSSVESNFIDSYTHSKSFKQTLHLKILKYLDLFCILFLILNKKLMILNYKSYRILIERLNVVCSDDFDLKKQSKDLILDYINNSSFHILINRFIINIENKFKFKEKKQCPLKPLSYEDFESCSLSLGRESFGLYSIVKTCMCNITNALRQGLDVEFQFERLSESWKTQEVSRCVKCVNDSDLIPLVGLVAPFVLQSHDNDSPSPTNRKKRKLLENDLKANDSFKLNQKLYSSTKYPLDYLFDEPKRENDASDESKSTHLGDLLFELACLILDGNKASKPDDVCALAFVIKDYLTMESTEDSEESNDGLIHNCVIEKIVDEYNQVLSKVGTLKPFPTMYWLIEKSLISKVSKLESDGMIKAVQNMIDERIDDYNHDKNVEDENFIKILIEDNLSYVLRRFKMLHPRLVELLYNIIFNSNLFSLDLDGHDDEYKYRYINLNFNVEHKDKNNKNILLFKALSILNTIRIHGIAGSKDFIHIKCLHTNLAYEIAEGSFIGNFVSKLI